MDDAPAVRVTPWVFRILVANGIVLLLMMTLFTSQSVLNLVRFDPAVALQRPWTFLTYIFVHGGIVHLATNSLALFVFGPTVERRLGPSVFPFYYLLCGVGAAIVSLAMWFVAPNMIGPFVGASGAVLGVALAFAKILPDAEMMVFPLPMPIKAKSLVAIFAVMDVAGAWLGADNIAHVAHLGGMAFGWLFFQAYGTGKQAGLSSMPMIRSRPPVAVRTMPAARMSSGEVEPVKIPATKAPLDPAVVEKAEVNRVLDKILATGIESLTPEERRLLEAQRRNGEMH